MKLIKPTNELAREALLLLVYLKINGNLDGTKFYTNPQFKDGTLINARVYYTQNRTWFNTNINDEFKKECNIQEAIMNIGSNLSYIKEVLFKDTQEREEYESFKEKQLENIAKSEGEIWC